MRARWTWFLLLALVVLAAPVLVAQTADTSAASGGNADAAYGVETLIKLGAMALGSFLFAQWNKTKAKLDGINNALKDIAITVLVTVLGMVGTLLHVAVSKDVADWTASFWMSLASGVGTFLIGKIAINSHKAKPLS